LAIFDFKAGEFSRLSTSLSAGCIRKTEWHNPSFAGGTRAGLDLAFAINMKILVVFFAVLVVVVVDAERISQAAEISSSKVQRIPSHFQPGKLKSLPFYEKITLKAYQNIGSRNPKWDSNAETALLLFGRQLADSESVLGTSNYVTMVSAFRNALRAGCDDPYVRYASSRLQMFGTYIEPELPYKMFKRILPTLKTYPYPPLIQGLMYLRAAEMMLADHQSIPEWKTQATQWLDEAATMAPKAIVGEVNRSEYYVFVSNLLNAYVKLSGDRKAPFDRLYAELERADSNHTVIPLVVKGKFYRAWAWDARGKGMANTVTEDGWKKMAERLPEARKALTAAWEKDPLDPNICSEMINVVLGGSGDREEMESWFERGRKAESGSYGPYACKLHFLKPRWHGSEEEMHQFALQCVKEGRWVDQLPFILISAHDEFATDFVSKEEHFRKPGVWEEIKLVYEEYLSRFPENNVKRSSYVYHAALCGQWAEVKKQMDLLGNLLVPTAFDSLGSYYHYREEIDQHAGVSNAKDTVVPVVFR
jgi:hypothetical protein